MSKKNKCDDCYLGTLDDGDGGVCFHCINYDNFIAKDSPEAKAMKKADKKIKENQKIIKDYEKRNKIKSFKDLISEDSFSLFSDGYGFTTDDKGKQVMADIDPMKLIKKLYYSCKMLLEDKDDLRKQIQEAEAKTETDKVKELEKEIDNLWEHSLIQLTDKEKKAVEDFQNKHFKKCAKAYCDKLFKEGHMPATGCSKGSTYIYTITGTGLGYCIKIKCPECGEELDITDTDKF